MPRPRGPGNATSGAPAKGMPLRTSSRTPRCRTTGRAAESCRSSRRSDRGDPAQPYNPSALRSDLLDGNQVDAVAFADRPFRRHLLASEWSQRRIGRAMLTADRQIDRVARLDADGQPRADALLRTIPVLSPLRPM